MQTNTIFPRCLRFRFTPVDSDTSDTSRRHSSDLHLCRSSYTYPRNSVGNVYRHSRYCLLDFGADDLCACSTYMISLFCVLTLPCVSFSVFFFIFFFATSNLNTFRYTFFVFFLLDWLAGWLTGRLTGRLTRWLGFFFFANALFSICSQNGADLLVSPHSPYMFTSADNIYCRS